MLTSFDPCPSCGAANAELLYTKGDLTESLTNVICGQCALVFVSPRPEAASFAEYQGASGKGSGHHALQSADAIARKIEERDRPLKKTVLAFLKPYVHAGMTVLDIGCGFGTLLAMCRDEFGMVPTGIELNEQDVRTAKEMFNLDLFFGSLEQFVIANPEKKFDLITLHHTFEHFLGPVAELGRLTQVLSDEGLLYIAVPNIMNIKKRPEIFFIKGHACTYSPASLTRILNANGFKIVAFNDRAGYHGGMELVAAKMHSSFHALESAALLAGSTTADVKTYVYSVDRRYKTLRFLRNGLLWWLPEASRIGFGRRIYLWLKQG